ncbi:MAG: ferritin-like domain-containing protein [Xanthomonadales bacterium]|nr:ferritin-like domain-containing protein [Xanthomonadales bacterium]
MASIEDNLHLRARACLAAPEPADKLAATGQAVADWRAGRLRASGEGLAPPERIDCPGRPARPVLVHPRALSQRGLGSAEGRAALVHAVAHIELNAIDLAWDAVYRFRDMPDGFYDDWISVAADEARHFGLLAARLADLGHAYGDFPAHNGLWEMALRTDHDCLQRMALVPRVLEARGLDVTPGMIDRLKAVGDVQTVAILETILREEVDHVAAGSRWFHWCCAQAGVCPDTRFHSLLEGLAPGALRGPLNLAARRAAGFSSAELDRLGQRVA